MNNQVKLAIVAIVIVIPIISFSVYLSEPNQTKKNDKTKLQVVSSFYPLHEFAQKIGKEKIDVKLLVPIGVEPHDWEPTIKDVQQMQNSDAIIINGLGFENWTDKLSEINYNGTIVNASNEIPLNSISKEFLEGDQDIESSDPHVWLNPNFAKIQVQNIANSFSRLNPENQKYFQDNADHFIAELDLLDLEIKNELLECNRDFITFHNAFSYFASEYNLNHHVIISSFDSSGEPTSKTLERIINKAKELDIKIIFAEEIVSAKTSEVIANEIGGKVLILSPIEINDGSTYISKMKENLNNLKEALC